MRQLRMRMPDDTIRSVMVPENLPVTNLMVIICTKLGQYPTSQLRANVLYSHALAFMTRHARHIT